MAQNVMRMFSNSKTNLDSPATISVAFSPTEIAQVFHPQKLRSLNKAKDLLKVVNLLQRQAQPAQPQARYKNSGAIRIDHDVEDQSADTAGMNTLVPLPH
jgi:hypothetical protein